MLISYGVPFAVTLLLGLLGDYLLLPTWSIFNPGIYFFIIVLIAVFECLHHGIESLWGWKLSLDIPDIALLATTGLLLLILLFGWIVSLPVFHAGAYSALIGEQIVETEIANLVISLDEVSILDKDTADQLALQKMESLTDLASDYDVCNSTQITYNGAPTQVMSLDYSSFIKSVSNWKAGVPAYISVDMRTQDVNIHYVDEPMRYTPRAIWGKDLMRHIHYSHPSAMLGGEPQLEIDDDGKPYFIVPVVRPAVLLFGGMDVTGIIMVDPCSGETDFYPTEEIPEWVDHAYPADMIISQYNMYGKYRDGFFGQRDTDAATSGYNYVCDTHDTLMYTGVASKSSDESTVGFLFVNLRTKEAGYYPLEGANELSAMTVAEQAVKTSGYTASFPLMLVEEGTPTYCMSLKGDDGAARMYAMVNVNKSHLVAVGQTLEECQSVYHGLVLSNDVTIAQGPTHASEDEHPQTVTGRILDIRTGEKGGTTYFYLRLEGNETWYVISLTDNEVAIKLNPTDTVVLNMDATAEYKEIIPAKLTSYTEGAPWWDN